jgi:hypothetical protein
MYGEVFECLKNMVYQEIRPQMQVIIRAKKSEIDNNKLPPTVRLFVPLSKRPLSSTSVESNLETIFGFDIEGEIQWEVFIKKSKEKHELLANMWKTAIQSVVSSALTRNNDSQLILSKDEQSVFRLILSKIVDYFDGTREFHIYFVEVLIPKIEGNAETTRLLVALDIVCRFRFLFLEKTSPYNIDYLKVQHHFGSQKGFCKAMQDLTQELDFLQAKALRFDLSNPEEWTTIIDDREVVAKMFITWSPLERVLRSNMSWTRKTGQLAKLCSHLLNWLSEGASHGTIS